MATLFTLEHSYTTIANVKNELVCINPDHVLRYNFSTKKLSRQNSNDRRRHLRFLKTPEGNELELVEEEGLLRVISGNKNVLAHPELVEGRIVSGSLAMASLHEYATDLEIKVVIITYLVAEKFSVLVIDWEQEAFLCEYSVEFSRDIASAEFFFESIFADAADVKYIKGSMIENENVVYDLTLVQLDSLKNKQATTFPTLFPKLFGITSLPISQSLLHDFSQFGIKNNPPKTLLDLHEHFQMPLIDEIIREGRVSLIEDALRQPGGKQNLT